jgi:hypothetical protein
LETYADNPGGIFGDSSINKAMMNAFTQTRNFVMNEYGLTEAEAWTIITQGVDFGMTQVVDGNWGVHGIVPKAIFDMADSRTECVDEDEPSFELGDEPVDEPVDEPCDEPSRAMTALPSVPMLMVLLASSVAFL